MEKKNEVDLTLDPSNDLKDTKRKRRTSKIGDCEKGITCGKCNVGIITQRTVRQQAGIMNCWECENKITKDKFRYCLNEECGFIWCRDCYKAMNRKRYTEIKAEYASSASEPDAEEEKELELYIAGMHPSQQKQHKPPN